MNSPISIEESVLCLEAPSLGVGVFKNQLVVDVVFEVPLSQKLFCWMLAAGKSSPHCLNCKAKERRQSICNITQRLCQLLEAFQTKDLSCILKCKCSVWKAVPRSTGEAAEGKTQARAINFYQTVPWHTNCFCIKLVLPFWESSEERWNMPRAWTRSSSRAALDPRQPWSIYHPPPPFLPLLVLTGAHCWSLLLLLEQGCKRPLLLQGIAGGNAWVLRWSLFFFTALLLSLPLGKNSDFLT